MRDDYLLGGMGRTMRSGMWEDRSNCTARGWGRCLPVATEYASLTTFPEQHSLRHRRSSGRAGRHIGMTNYHRRSIMTIDKRILRPVTDFRIAWSGCWVAFLHMSCTKMTRRDALPCLGSRICRRSKPVQLPHFREHLGAESDGQICRDRDSSGDGFGLLNLSGVANLEPNPTSTTTETDHLGG